MVNKSGHILALDQGTTNTKALLIDESGTIIASESHPVSQSYPSPAWVEQDAMELWQSVQSVIESCLVAAGKVRLRTLAVNTSRESVLVREGRSDTTLVASV